MDRVRVAVVGLGFGGEFVPSLVKGQAKLNGVRIGGAGPS